MALNSIIYFSFSFFFLLLMSDGVVVVQTFIDNKKPFKLSRQHDTLASNIDRISRDQSPVCVYSMFKWHARSKSNWTATENKWKKKNSRKKPKNDKLYSICVGPCTVPKTDKYFMKLLFSIQKIYCLILPKLRLKKSISITNVYSCLAWAVVQIAAIAFLPFES